MLHNNWQNQNPNAKSLTLLIIISTKHFLNDVFNICTLSMFHVYTLCVSRGVKYRQSNNQAFATCESLLQLINIFIYHTSYICFFLNCTVTSQRVFS